VDQNLLLLTDSYKATHWKQYPPGTERIYSYFESRGGRFDEVVFFGLQYYLDRYLTGRVVTRERIERAADFWARHFGDPALFNRAGWEHVLHEHGGRLPVSVRAVAEGTPVPLRNVLMTVENTDPRCYWLTNHLETLLVQVWYGSTVATLSREMKRVILDFLERTGDPALIPSKLHDFGFRGTSSVESASLGGAAHLVSFEGTDTVAGCLLAQEYYAADMPGTSIPASEHSTITAWGPEEELGAFENMLNAYPTGTVACVSDSWDIYRACAQLWGSELRDRVLARDGTLVIRPDSGDPPAVVTRVLDLLGESFGAERNAKGFKLLPPQVRVIQGDGIGYEMTRSILSAMERAGWSADNISFGMGGGLLQKLDRDTQEFAFKCSEITRDGVARDVYKDPVTDHGKHSKRGRLKLVRTGTGGYATVAQSASGDDLLREVFRDGEVMVRQSFEEIRRRASVSATR
jgi:nicotinamide phosphoribosyltransferase